MALGEHVGRGRLEVGEEAVLLGHGHPVGLAADHDAAGVVDGVAGAGDERDVAGVDEREEEVRDALLAADEREHSRCSGRRRRRSGASSTPSTPRGSAARRRSSGTGGWRGSWIASTIASTMWSGVGVSGSPMPSEMTSMPCAVLSAFLRSISANRYGGRLSIRLAVLTGRSLLSSGCRSELGYRPEAVGAMVALAWRGRLRSGYAPSTAAPRYGRRSQARQATRLRRPRRCAWYPRRPPRRGRS